MFVILNEKTGAYRRSGNMGEIAAKNGRIDGLDVLKCICAFFVVEIHISFGGGSGTF